MRHTFQKQVQQALATITKLLQQHMAVKDLVRSPTFGAVSAIPQPQPCVSFPGPGAYTQFTAVGSQGLVFESLIALFESLDQDRDGHIAREEYNAGFHFMARDGDANACLSREEYEAGFDLLDTDRDGFITKSEFTRFISNHSEAAALSQSPTTMLDAFRTKLSLDAQAPGTRATQIIRGTSNCRNMQMQEIESAHKQQQVLSQKDVNILDPIKAHHDRTQEPQQIFSRAEIENSIVLKNAPKNANNIASKMTKKNTTLPGVMSKLAPRIERIRNLNVASSTMSDALISARARIKRGEVNRAVDNSMTDIVGAESSLLAAQMAQVLDKVSEFEGSGQQTVAALATLDAVKTRLKECEQMLAEAESVSRILAQLDPLFPAEKDELREIASRLGSLRRSLRVESMGQLEKFSDAAARLEGFEDRNRYVGRQPDSQTTIRPDSNVSHLSSADVVTVGLMRRRMRMSKEEPLTSHPLPSTSLTLSPRFSTLSSRVFPPPQLPPVQPLAEIVRDTSLHAQLPPLQPIVRDTCLHSRYFSAAEVSEIFRDTSLHST